MQIKFVIYKFFYKLLRTEMDLVLTYSFLFFYIDVVLKMFGRRRKERVHLSK